MWTSAFYICADAVETPDVGVVLNSDVTVKLDSPEFRVKLDKRDYSVRIDKREYRVKLDKTTNDIEVKLCP